MADSTELAPPSHISRRTLVKRGLVVGGALWATPVVSVLTATKASASQPSSNPNPSPSGAVAISYVILVLDCDGTYVTVKINEGSTVSCPAVASSELGSDIIYAAYLAANPSWSPISTSSTCPKLGVGTNANGDVVVTLDASCKLVGYMVHDGSLPPTRPPQEYSMDRFAAGTNIPVGAYTTYPAGWSVPSVPSTFGATVTFHKG